MITAQSLLNWLFKLDKHLTGRFSGGSNKPLGKLLSVYTELGSSLGAFFIFVVLFAISGSIVLKFAVIYLVQLGVVESIKFLTKRPRPKAHLKRIIETNVFGLRVSSGSFPSGHASNVTTIAVLITAFYNISGNSFILVFLTAFTIAISRIYLRKHYLLDVLGGALIGFAISNLLIAVLF